MNSITGLADGNDMLKSAAMTAVAANPAAATALQAAKIIDEYAPPLFIDMPPDNDYPQVEELKKVILDELLKHPNFAPKYEDTPVGGNLENKLVNSKFCQIIEDYLTCDHTHTLLVKSFIKFIESKVLSSHYHSKTEGDNDKFINSMDIFYRHGLSKIISKIFEEITTNQTELSSFLQKLEERILKMKDADLIQFLTDQNLLFELMDDKHINTLINQGMDKSQIGALMVELYNKEDFDELLSEVEPDETERNNWQKEYQKYLDIKKEEDAEKRNDILEKIKNNLLTPQESKKESNTYMLVESVPIKD
jgi:hypothetical protein